MNNLPVDIKNKDLLRGLIYIAGGVALLMYSLGIIERGITTLFVIASIVLIVYGIMKSGLYEKIERLIKK